MLNRKFTLFSLSSIFLLSSTLINSSAQEPLLSPAKSAPELRNSLQGLYESWRTAVANKDLAAWEQVTAISRQVKIRNRIVSEKAPFPQAFFEDPLQAPSLGGLISLGCLSRGDTATSIYFGKIAFGPTPENSKIPDNLLVLRFFKNDGVWKFDNLRLVKIGNDGDILLNIRNQNFSFLKGAEFQPPLAPDPIPQAVNPPDYVAELWITAIGYEVDVLVNGHISASVADYSGKELVIGGVKKGKNNIEIKTKALTETKSGLAPKVEIAIYAQIKKDSIKRVFHYRPGKNVEANVKTEFYPPLN